jgi:hypothetical protein
MKNFYNFIIIGLDPGLDPDAGLEPEAGFEPDEGLEPDPGLDPGLELLVMVILVSVIFLKYISYLY